MSLLARAKLSLRGRLSLLHCITARQQSNLYSTKIAPPRARRLAEDDGTQKPSESSLSDRIKKKAGSKIDWPKPAEIPYQARVANSVKLIGRVKTPVQVESDTDGNHIAAVVVSQEMRGEFGPLLIPVVFEGDLAHVVARHVKEKDRVLVSGQLSVGLTRFVFDDGLGNLYLVADNLNFVEGFGENVRGKKLGFSSVKIEKPSVKSTQDVVSRVSSVQIENHLAQSSEDVVKKVECDEEFSQKWKEALEKAKGKRFSVEDDWASNSVLQLSNNEADNSERVESKLEMGVEKISSGTTKMKNEEHSLDLWSDLVETPKQWLDFRNHKARGLLKAKFPDFKRKGTGNALWVDRAPKWVLPELGRLEFDVEPLKIKPAQGGEGVGQTKELDVKLVKANQIPLAKEEDSWRSLVEYPYKWWDNRLDKRNPRAPDFKHKETGMGLWLNDTPDWALSRLPQLKDEHKSMRAL